MAQRRRLEPAAETRPTILTVKTPAKFSFELTVCSHGWLVLAPNVWSQKRKLLTRPVRLADGKIVILSMSEAPRPDHAVRIEVHEMGGLTAWHVDKIRDFAIHTLRLGQNLSGFYEECERRGGHWSGALIGAGRLLRSPTVFEDIVKTICTTNIQWSGTVRIVERLVENFGEPFGGDEAVRTFPTPERIATEPFEAFRSAVGAGYRAQYIHELATRIANKDLDVEALLDRKISSSELRSKLLAIKGVGPYAAATLQMLLGRYDQLGIDTEFRDFVSHKYFGGKKTPDKKLKAVYDDWGEWKYLAYWFEVWSTFQRKVSMPP